MTNYQMNGIKNQVVHKQAGRVIDYNVDIRRMQCDLIIPSVMGRSTLKQVNCPKCGGE